MWKSKITLEKRLEKTAGGGTKRQRAWSNWARARQRVKEKWRDEYEQPITHRWLPCVGNMLSFFCGNEQASESDLIQPYQLAQRRIDCVLSVCVCVSVDVCVFARLPSKCFRCCYIRIWANWLSLSVAELLMGSDGSSFSYHIPTCSQEWNCALPCEFGEKFEIPDPKKSSQCSRALSCLILHCLSESWSERSNQP